MSEYLHPTLLAPCEAETPCVYQLRIYEVDPAKRQAFHDRFENHALRIMKCYDFEVIALWESTSLIDFEFVYILRWPDLGTMQRQWDLFMADEEWIGIKKAMAGRIGEPVRRVSSSVLDVVGYSPSIGGRAQQALRADNRPRAR